MLAPASLADVHPYSIVDEVTSFPTRNEMSQGFEELSPTVRTGGDLALASAKSAGSTPRKGRPNVPPPKPQKALIPPPRFLPTVTVASSGAVVDLQEALRLA